jgi:hypothetical protein
MNKGIGIDDWDQEFKELLGTAPAPDFETWHAKHLQELEGDRLAAVRLEPSAMTSNYGRKWKVAMLQTAATVALVCGVFWMIATFSSNERIVVAAEIQGVDRVASLGWTETFFIRVTSADKQRTWIEQEKVDVLYQHPGKYRKTHFDTKGGISFIEVIDANANRTLSMNPRNRKAELKYQGERIDERGPFAWVGDYMRGKEPGKVSLQGQHTFDGKETDVVQWKGISGAGRVKFYLVKESNQLAGITTVNPGVDFDPEEHSRKGNAPTSEAWYLQEPIASRTDNMNLNATIDKLTFSLDAPADYQLEKIAKPTVTEAEVLSYLGAAAEWNERVFPGSAIEAFDGDKLNAVSKLAEKDRPAAASAFIEIRDKIMMREIYRSPVLQFIDDHVEKDTFQYVGDEVKWGDATSRIAWYQPKGKDIFRVWFGDLSVKELPAKSLPILSKQP